MKTNVPSSGKERKLGWVHGLGLVAFALWDVQQFTQHMKEAGSGGFEYLVSSAFGCLPEENKIMFLFQKVPSSSQI